ncbi:MAG TPA: hypothetical protein VF519_12615 [Mycobacteriales bacterium]|jgi:hypothetical protein
MRLLLAGLVAGASVIPALGASAVECDRYGDKPCVVFCEVYAEWHTQLQRLVEDPPDPACGPAR